MAVVKRISRTSDERSPSDQPRRFEELVEQHAREIQLFLAKLCGNHHDAEELAQDVFVKAYRKLGSLREGAAVRRWLYTIAVNHFNDWVKPQKRTAIRAVGDIAHYDVAARRCDRPTAQAASREFNHWLNDCILELPSRQRTVLLMFLANGFNYADIAEALGITADAVKMSLFHAREKLRTRVDRYAEER